MRLKAHKPVSDKDIYFTYKGDVYIVHFGKATLDENTVLPVVLGVTELKGGISVIDIQSRFNAGFPKKPHVLFEHLVAVQELAMINYKPDAIFFFKDSDGASQQISIVDGRPVMSKVPEGLVVYNANLPYVAQAGMNLDCEKATPLAISEYYGELLSAYRTLCDVVWSPTGEIPYPKAILTTAERISSQRRSQHGCWYPQGNDSESFHNACVTILTMMLDKPPY